MQCPDCERIGDNLYRANTARHLLDLACQNRTKVQTKGIETLAEQGRMQAEGVDVIQVYRIAKLAPVLDRADAA